MNRHEIARRKFVESKIRQFIARKKRYNHLIKVDDIAKELDMGRQNLSTYYMPRFKDEIEEHNKNVKRNHVRGIIDRLIKEGKEVSVVIVSGLARCRAQYVQKEFGDEIRKIRHEYDQSKPIYTVIDALIEVNKIEPITREEVEKFLCKKFSLKLSTVEQRYGTLLGDFEPRVKRRRKLWLEEVLDICVGLVERGIPPTLSSIQLMRSIVSESNSNLKARRKDLLVEINKHFNTDFSSFEEIRESAVIITGKDGQPTLTKSLLFKADETTEKELEPSQ